MMVHVAMIDGPLVQRVGLTLAHTVWQAAAAAGVLGVVLAVVRRSAGVRYVAACAALAATAAAAVVTFAVLGDGPARVGVVAETATPAVMSAAPAEVAAVAPSPAATGRLVVGWVVLLWGVGVAGQAAWHAVGWAGVRRLGRAPAVADPRWTAALVTAADRVGVRRAVRLLASARVGGPVVLGVLRPAVVVPVSMVAELPPDHVAAVLAHELAHVGRHDYLVNLIQCGVEAVLFHHPAVWWMSAVARREREHCCDDVAAAAVGSRPAVAAMLVALEEQRGSRWAVAAGGSLLPGRVRRLTTRPTPTRPVGPVVAALAGVAAVVVALVGTAGPRPVLAVTPPTTRPTPTTRASSTDVEAFPADPELARLRRDRVAAAARLGDASALYRPAHPEVIGAQRHLASLDEAIAARVGALNGGTGGGVAYVGGDVLRPGVYSFRADRPTAAGQLVASAGRVPGATAWVSVSRAAGDRVTRVLDATPLDVLDADPSADVPVRDGDVVRVTTVTPARPTTRGAGLLAGAIYVGGDVPRPGVYSVSGRTMTIKQAVVAAGDVKVEHGRQAWVTVRRRGADGWQEVTISEVPFAGLLDGTVTDLTLQENDVLTVAGVDPATRARALAKSFAVFGAVKRPAGYGLIGCGTSVSQAIRMAGGTIDGADHPVTIFRNRGAIRLKGIDGLSGDEKTDPFLMPDDVVIVPKTGERQP